MNIFWDVSNSSVRKYKVKLYDCYVWDSFVICLTYKDKFCGWYTRDSFVWNTKVNFVTVTHRLIWLNLKLYSAIFNYNVKHSEQKIVFYELWLAEANFLAISGLIWWGAWVSIWGEHRGLKTAFLRELWKYKQKLFLCPPNK